jgi:hypothetical protein
MSQTLLTNDVQNLSVVNQSLLIDDFRSGPFSYESGVSTSPNAPPVKDLYQVGSMLGGTAMWPFNLRQHEVSPAVWMCLRTRRQALVSCM